MRGAQKQCGFTLIEMITVIVLLGIIAGILTPFIGRAISAYSDSRARADLVAKGRLALERIAREVRHAVPNSVSVLAGGSGIEFARSRTGGRYVEQFDNFGSEFSRTNYRFRRNANRSNLYVVGTGLSLQANDVLVIANTSPAVLQGGTASVALSGISNTTVANDGTANGQILNFPAHQFLVESPGRHFSIANRTVEVGLSGGTLRLHSAAGLGDYDSGADWGAGDPVLVDGVTAVNFAYAAGSPQSGSVLRMDLQLNDAAAGESIRLYYEVQVRNTL
jgi:MSHA biogenesis protein MshO